jgi:bacteriocin biosynthesis cyclodehydratase domain-containing protein
MRRPRIKRTIEFIEKGDGSLILARPSAETDVTVEQPTMRDREMLAALDGEMTLSELQARYGAAEINDLISGLEGFGAIEDAADDDLIEAGDLARFDRQLRYFSDVGASGLTPSECQQHLREAKVAVLGVGGLGGSAAIWLACCGIGEMWLVDGDRVEVSNFNRQILYDEADIGELKAERAASRLRAFNSGMRVTATAQRLESPAEVAEFIHGADVVVDAADWPAHEIERWCNAACFELGIPYITMSHFPPVARVGPFFVPGVTGCFECQVTAMRARYPLLDVGIEQRRAQPSPAATLGPACGMIGGQVGVEVMHLLTGLAEPSTMGTAHIYDLRTMEVEREEVKRDPTCPVCSDITPTVNARDG